ncbi:DNA translocase FtsK [Alkalihalobacillus sp. BA299]|uniref:DNA translocase FtsK n=1 Tax=Alkalihalobacillus sp. BA299 TaxID=2815938 RepID=UPI001ADA2566|nr:DNA translocase FtsK [Alkalihalobacillus sp. BA299]
MVSKHTKWLRKIQEWFLGKEETSTVEPNRRNSHYGRLEADDRPTEMRVVHQYPKQGKFRFPVIEDEPEVVQSKKKGYETKNDKQSKSVEKTRVDSTYQGSREEDKSSNEKKRELFTNSQFKPTAIPSPVYGFKQREKKYVAPIVEDFQVIETSSKEDFLKPPAKSGELSGYQIDQKGGITNDEYEVAATIELDTQENGDLNLLPRQQLADEFLSRETELTQGQEEAIEKLMKQQEPEEIYEELEHQPESEEVYEEHEHQPESEEVYEEPEHQPESEEIYEEHEHQPESEEIYEEHEHQPESEEIYEELEHQPKSEEIYEELEHQPESKEVYEEPEHQTVSEKVYEEPPQQPDLEQEKVGFQPHQEVANGVDKEIPSKTQIQQEKVRKPQSEQVPMNKKQEEPIRKNTKTFPFNVLMLPQDRLDKQRKASNVEKVSYYFPPIHMLNIPPRQEEEDSAWLNEQGEILESTLQNFNVSAKVIHVTKGPSVTRFEIQPAPGVKVSKITSLTDDIKLCLAAKDIRMEAPIPGKHAIGIEVPNMKSDPVFLREILRRGVFQKGSPLTVALGLDISGQPIVTDLAKMPHGLVAGATGSGKSVCINSILISLLYKATPDQVKLLLVDPKMVELAPYNELPHLVTPVITDAKQATAALKWVVAEMERRYELFSQQGVRDIGRYNDLYSEHPEKPALPYIVVVIDELADLMMVSPQDVEEAICRIAQKARACGIHLLLATQRPSVDVITGLIKANIPTRIAFSVSSQVDSRTIIDMNGAERLLGKGDMLFHENGTAKPIRVQGTFVSDEEIERVIEFVKKQRKPQYLIENEHLNKGQEIDGQEDDLFEEACYFVIEQDGASASSLQRRFRVGYNRAARLIDMMEAKGIVSEAMGSKPRHILMSVTEFEENILATTNE